MNKKFNAWWETVCNKPIPDCGMDSIAGDMAYIAFVAATEQCKAELAAKDALLIELAEALKQVAFSSDTYSACICVAKEARVKLEAMKGGE